MSPEHPESSQPALWVSSQPLADNAALVHFYSPDVGALTLKAPGLLKPTSKLAPLLQPADELRISSVAGRGGMRTLTGASLEKAHPAWRAELRRLSLLWFMLECGTLASSTPQVNSAAYQLTVNLLRSDPQGSELAGALAVYCLKLLALHGLLPDLLRCALDGHYLEESEPSFLLPSGEGLCGREAYNQQYARGSAGLLRLDPSRRARWLALLHGPLLRYGAREADAVDSAALLHLAAQRLSDIADRGIGSARFLEKQWKLQPYAQLCRESV